MISGLKGEAPPLQPSLPLPYSLVLTQGQELRPNQPLKIKISMISYISQDGVIRQKKSIFLNLFFKEEEIDVNLFTKIGGNDFF